MTDELIKLSVEDAAKTFNKSKDTIYYWIKTNKYSSEKDDNGNLMLVLTGQQYNKQLPKIETQSNSNKIATENSNEPQPNLKQEDLKYIIENFKYLADVALEEKEKRILLLEDNGSQWENNYHKIKAELKTVEDKNAVLEFQLNEAETKLNTIESQFKVQSDSKDNEINALKKQIEALREQRNKGLFNWFKK